MFLTTEQCCLKDYSVAFQVYPIDKLKLERSIQMESKGAGIRTRLTRGVKSLIHFLPRDPNLFSDEAEQRQLSF